VPPRCQHGAGDVHPRAENSRGERGFGAVQHAHCQSRGHAAVLHAHLERHGAAGFFIQFDRPGNPVAQQITDKIMYYGRENQQ